MGKRKRRIVWTHIANIHFFRILDFYTQRNKSTTYSKRIYKKIKRELGYLIDQPEIGVKTDEESVIGLIVEDFIVYYELTIDDIIIHTVWDSRQNPDNLKIKE